jgi:glyoxylase-like metal-dependent hydrolase (beta-lactamase superfamily II)
LEELVVFNTGWCFSKEALTIRGGRWRTVAIPVYAALLHHPTQGYGLFDTGFAPRFHDAIRFWPFSLYRQVLGVDLPPHLSLVNQLQRRGIAPVDIRWIVLSHLHTDHVAGLADFPAARIYTNRSGFDWMQSLSPFHQVRKGFVPALLPPGWTERVIWLEAVTHTADMPPFGTVIDLFNDGSLLLLPLEGHCRGQVGVLVQMPGQEPLLLAADAFYSFDSVRTNRGLPAFTHAISHSAAAFGVTLERVRQFHRMQPDVPVISAHCVLAPDLFPKWFAE